MARIPTTPPTIRSFDLSALVRKAWGDEWLKKETAYEFSNGRKFEDSGVNGGPYTGTATGS